MNDTSSLCFKEMINIQKLFWIKSDIISLMHKQNYYRQKSNKVLYYKNIDGIQEVGLLKKRPYLPQRRVWPGMNLRIIFFISSAVIT